MFYNKTYLGKFFVELRPDFETFLGFSPTLIAPTRPRFIQSIALANLVYNYKIKQALPVSLQSHMIFKDLHQEQLIAVDNI